MTDNELKELVAGLAVSNAELTVKMRENAEQMKRTDELMNKNAEQMKRTDEQMNKNAEQVKKDEAKLARMGFTLGNMANNHGESTEEYFYNSLYDDPRLGNIVFDEITKNIHGKVARLEDEFDIAMYNGNNIALIECKYKAHENDVINLIEKKVQNFKQLFPFYANHTFYLGIASFSFYPKLEELAKEKGVAILRQKGEVVEIEADNLKAY
jgi:hypothetical protein